MESSKSSFFCGEYNSLKLFFHQKLIIESCHVSLIKHNYLKTNNSSKMKRAICHLVADKIACNKSNSTTSSASSLWRLLQSGGLNAPYWTSKSKTSLPCPLHACVLWEKIHEEKKSSYFMMVLAKTLIIQN